MGSKQVNWQPRSFSLVAFRFSLPEGGWLVRDSVSDTAFKPNYCKTKQAQKKRSMGSVFLCMKILRRFHEKGLIHTYLSHFAVLERKPGAWRRDGRCEHVLPPVRALPGLRPDQVPVAPLGTDDLPRCCSCQSGGWLCRGDCVTVRALGRIVYPRPFQFEKLRRCFSLVGAIS